MADFEREKRANEINICTITYTYFDAKEHVSANTQNPTGTIRANLLPFAHVYGEVLFRVKFAKVLTKNCLHFFSFSTEAKEEFVAEKAVFTY